MTATRTTTTRQEERQQRRGNNEEATTTARDNDRVLEEQQQQPTTMTEEAVKKTMVGVNVRLERQQKFKWIEWSDEDYNSLEEIVGHIKNELKGKEQEGEWHLYRIKGTKKEKIDGINQIVEGQLVELQKEKSAIQGKWGACVVSCYIGVIICMCKIVEN